MEIGGGRERDRRGEREREGEMEREMKHEEENDLMDLLQDIIIKTVKSVGKILFMFKLVQCNCYIK